MRNAVLPPLFLLAIVGCSTVANRTTPISEPKVVVTQVSGVPPAARFVQGAISIRYHVRVENTADEPITLKRVNIESIGLGAYTIRHSAPFDVAIGATEKRDVDFWASGQTEENAVGANGPTTLRVTAFFETASGKFENSTTQTVSAMGLAKSEP